MKYYGKNGNKMFVKITQMMILGYVYVTLILVKFMFLHKIN